MYTLVAYTHELLFFLLLVCSCSPFKICTGNSNPKSTPMI